MARQVRAIWSSRSARKKCNGQNTGGPDVHMRRAVIT
eukprot:CAMPEP_0179117724 /NCGR_PEP_ID=MMETSP0796-20121207/55312_1 /TAXON_ID=73915 /ORGANISM="Pyrodinium bahamense, Strain pbaha01" /LENGTH=36 /DNA_ID= /DNA_START= /DNA_END= /DNA_ORIENTATION=